MEKKSEFSLFLIKAALLATVQRESHYFFETKVDIIAYTNNVIGILAHKNMILTECNYYERTLAAFLLTYQKRKRY